MALFDGVKNKCLIFQGDKAELADFEKSSEIQQLKESNQGLQKP